MKIKSEDILKPGAKLEVKKIDWSDPEVMAMVAEAKRENEKMKIIRVRRYVNQTITI